MADTRDKSDLYRQAKADWLTRVRSSVGSQRDQRGSASPADRPELVNVLNLLDGQIERQPSKVSKAFGQILLSARQGAARPNV